MIKKESGNKGFVVLLFVLFTLSLCTARANTQTLQISVFGGWSHIFESGSEADYSLGANDFPVNPAHTPIQLGAALGFFLSDHIGIELDYRYFLSSRVTLVDPSDQDTVEIDTGQHYTLTFNLIYRVLYSRLSPYVLVGGGFDNLLAEDENYVSEFGFDIEFMAPEKKTKGAVNIGCGVTFLALPKLGARLDVRYSLIFEDPDYQKGLGVAFGLAYTF